ncbi:hypothetical protein [Anaerorhabdus sp.]|uniref:hypothetical protein n=1 Tax=Anaerorhabdus sp. TaxID=1872524 RepID=UPI002FC58FF5
MNKYTLIRRLILCLLLVWLIGFEGIQLRRFQEIFLDYHLLVPLQTICLLGYGYLTLTYKKNKCVREFAFILLTFFVLSIFFSAGFIHSYIHGFELLWDIKVLFNRLVISILVLMMFDVIQIENNNKNLKEITKEFFSSTYLTITLIISCILFCTTDGIKVFFMFNEKREISTESCISYIGLTGPLGYTKFVVNEIGYYDSNKDIEGKILSLICGSMEVSHNGSEPITTTSIAYDYVNPGDLIEIKIQPNESNLALTNWEYDTSPFLYEVEKQPVGISDFTKEVREMIDNELKEITIKMEDMWITSTEPLDILLFQSNYGVKDVYLVYVYDGGDTIAINVDKNPYIENNELKSSDTYSSTGGYSNMEDMLNDLQAMSIKSYYGNQYDDVEVELDLVN